jgi:hypothetical protein
MSPFGQRGIQAALAEMNRLLEIGDLEPERIGDETPQQFVIRKALDAAVAALDRDGLIDQGSAALAGRPGFSPLDRKRAIQVLVAVGLIEP